MLNIMNEKITVLDLLPHLPGALETFQDIKPNRNNTQRSANHMQGTMLLRKTDFVQNTMTRQLSHRCILDPLITTINLQDLCCYYDRFYWRKSYLKIEFACSGFCFKNTINFPQCPLGHRRNKRNHNNDFVNSSKFVHLSKNEHILMFCIHGHDFKI